MKPKHFLIPAFILLAYSGQAQIEVGYHHSQIPFIDFSYEVYENTKPHLRIGTNTNFGSSNLELDITYDYLNKDFYELYAGLGGNLFFESITIPIGMNMYPFDHQNFGFHMEITPIIQDEILRGTFGIRYRFEL